MKLRQSHFRLLLGALLLLPVIGVLATPPDSPTWWTDTGNQTSIIAANTTPDNASLANVGQVKFVAFQARAYLNQQLSSVGGAGPSIDAVVNSFAQNTPDNYAPANLGQLKYIAQPFYDRLLQVGYDTKANLIARGYSSGWSSNYAWPAPPARPGQAGYNSTTYNAWLQLNYAPLNLGQLKMVFSFALPTGSSLTTLLNAIHNAYASGLPDIWLTTGGLYPFYGSSGAGGDASTTYSYLDEYGATLGHDPDSPDTVAVALVVFKPLQ